MARSSESDSVYSASQQLSGHDPIRRRRIHDRHEGLDGDPLDSGTHRLNALGVNIRAAPVSPSADLSGGQPIRDRHQPLPLLNMSPTNEKSLALAAAIAQANGLVLQPDPNRPSHSHRPPSPISPTTHGHISPAPEYPSPPPSEHSSPYPSGVSAAIQEALESLHPPQASSKYLRVVGGSPFTIPASLPATPVLIASFPTTPSGASQSIYPTDGDVCPSPMPVPAGQSPYLKDRLAARRIASNMDLYPPRSASVSHEPRDDEGFQMDLDEQFTIPDYPEDDIVQIEPLEVYRPPPPLTMPPFPPTIISSRPPTQPLATKSSKGHHLELDISGLARRFTSSSHKSSTKSVPPGIVPSAPADSLSTALTTVLDPSTHNSTGGSGVSPYRFLRKAQSQSRLRDTPASGASSLSSQSSLSWIGGSSTGSGGSSRLPGLPRRQKSFQNPPPLPVPIPMASSSSPSLRHAGLFNHSAGSGSPPEDKSKGKEKEKVEKEKATSPRKRFFNSSKYSSGNSLVLEMEYAGLIGKMHEAEPPPPMQRHQPSLQVEISSPVNRQGLPLPRAHHSRPRSAPSQRMNSRSLSTGPPSALRASTSPQNGHATALDDEWVSHFSSPLTVSGLIIHEAPTPSALRIGGVVPGTSPPLSQQIDEDNTSLSPQRSPTTSLFSFRTEERCAARQHIIPPSELLKLSEEAREHTSALHSPPNLSRARSAQEYPAMSGFAANGTPVGFAALRARSTSTSRLPSDSAALASPILGSNRTRSQRAGSAGASMSLSTLGRPFVAYASGSISSPNVDLGGAAPTRSLSVLSKASSMQSSPAAKARRPSTAGSLQISTPLSPLVGFANPNGGTQSLPPPPRPRLPSLRTGGSTVYGPGHNPTVRTSTSTEFVSPVSTLTSAPTLSSGASWARTTSSPNPSRPPSSASLGHPPVQPPSASVVAAATQRQRSVLKKPSFLEIGDEDEDARINGPEGEMSVAGRLRISRTSTNATSRTSSSYSSSGGRSRAPSSASLGRSVHRVPSKASLRAHQQPVNVVLSDSFLEFDTGITSMDTIRQHPDEHELGENERVLGYRY